MSVGWAKHILPYKQLIQDGIVTIIEQVIVIFIIGGISEMNLGVQIHYQITTASGIVPPRLFNRSISK
ncbi:hypothetical protein HJC23_008605 [Cyclotella cryptica]|uniref:Uncharacterized protein n=1 Tax=Cyclotella cryptica TaxID=29204 RepID=A0ABD3Q832_9STRA